MISKEIMTTTYYLGTDGQIRLGLGSPATTVEYFLERAGTTASVEFIAPIETSPVNFGFDFDSSDFEE